MAKVDREELYPLFYALHAHHTGNKSIDGVKLDDDLTDAVVRFARKHDNRPVAPERQLTPERVKAIVKSVKHDAKIQIIVCEDGPDAPRPKTQKEIAQEKADREAEAQRLVRKFFISGSYGTLAFITAKVLIIIYINLDPWEAPVTDGPMVEGVDPTASTLHPLQIAALICIVIAAWGIAEAVVIAKNHWADFDRVKGAVPVVGKAWLARTKRKRREKEKRMLEGANRS